MDPNRINQTARCPFSAIFLASSSEQKLKLYVFKALFKREVAGPKKGGKIFAHIDVQRCVTFMTLQMLVDRSFASQTPSLSLAVSLGDSSEIYRKQKFHTSLLHRVIKSFTLSYMSHSSLWHFTHFKCQCLRSEDETNHLIITPFLFINPSTTLQHVTHSSSTSFGLVHHFDPD